MKLKTLIGSGHRIMLLTLPFLAAGLVLNIVFPSWFSVGGPPLVLKAISIGMLIPGVAIWVWSVVLILTRVPRKELITGGPYSLVCALRLPDRARSARGGARRHRAGPGRARRPFRRAVPACGDR